MAPQMTNVPLPADLVREMEAQAKRFGMSLPTYLAFLSRVDLRRHGPEFTSGARALFSKYAGTLRKLAQ